MSTQERGIQAAFEDTKIATHIKDKLVGKRYEYLTEVSVDVLQGDVLLTGVVESPDLASQVEQIARSVSGVNTVYNELFTSGGYSSKQYSKDAWIAAQLRGRLFAAKDLNASNFQISVVNQHVYLFGLTDSASDKERAVHLARITKNVTKVYDYTKLSQGYAGTEGQKSPEEVVHTPPVILQSAD